MSGLSCRGGHTAINGGARAKYKCLLMAIRIILLLTVLGKKTISWALNRDIPNRKTSNEIPKSPLEGADKAVEMIQFYVDDLSIN